jgi:hypothetical protein
MCGVAEAHETVRARAAIQLGNAQLELWHADLASDWYRRALEAPGLGADRRFALRGLGVSEYVQGRTQDGIRWMELAVQEQTDDPVARGWLAALLALGGREEEARREARVFFGIPGDGVRQAGVLPRVYLLAPEYDGRNSLVRDAVARLRADGRPGGGTPSR